MRKGNADPLPPHLQAEWERLEAAVDGPVDCSDIPEATDAAHGVRGRFSSTARRVMGVSLDVALVEYVERAAPGSLDDRLNALLWTWVDEAKQAAD